MEQLSTRYMTDHDRRRRNEIHETIGELLDQRRNTIFSIVKQFVSLMPAGDVNELMSPEKKAQLETQWFHLKKLKISVDSDETDDYKTHQHYLINLIFELDNVETFDKAFSMWEGKQKVWWRQLRSELSPDGRKIFNLELQKQSRILKHAIDILSLDLSGVLDDILREIVLINEPERQYATLLLEKINKEKIKVSYLSEYYLDTAWVLIHNGERKAY